MGCFRERREEKGCTHLCRVEHEGADVSVAFALDLLDGFGRRHAGNHDVAFLLEIDDEWGA